MAVVDSIEGAYERWHIFKTVVLCAHEDEVHRVATQLTKNDHTVVCITEDDMTDDRPLYRDRLYTFVDGHARVIVLSYATWKHLGPDVDMFLVPNHNLLAFGDVEDIQMREVLDGLLDARARGFEWNGLEKQYHVICPWTYCEDDDITSDIEIEA